MPFLPTASSGASWHDFVDKANPAHLKKGWQHILLQFFFRACRKSGMKIVGCGKIAAWHLDNPISLISLIPHGPFLYH